MYTPRSHKTSRRKHEGVAGKQHALGAAMSRRSPSPRRRYDDRYDDRYDRYDDRRRDDRYDDRRRDYRYDDRRRDDRDRYSDRERERQRDREKDRDRERERDRDREYRERDRGDRDRDRRDHEEGGGGSREEGLPLSTGAGPASADRRPNHVREAEERAAALAAKKAKEEEEYQRRVAEQMAEVEENEEEAEARLIEERRRRRAEIAARHAAAKAAASNGAAEPSGSAVVPQVDPPHALAAEAASAPAPGSSGPAGASTSAAPGSAFPPSTRSPATTAAAGTMASSYPTETAAGAGAGRGSAVADAEMPNDDAEILASADAANSDSDDDAERSNVPQRQGSHEMSAEARVRESELRKYLMEQRRSEDSAATAKIAAAAAAKAEAMVKAAAETGDDAGGFDMFNDEVDEREVADEANAVDEAAAMDRGDNYDDKEGYYAHRVGDVLNDRYKILGAYGKGAFSTVVRCLDLKSPTVGYEVAIKVQRNNEMMRRAGEKEIHFLNMLASNDPDNKKHVIRFLGEFDHEDHLCMVFEAMHQNLRSALRQHGHRRGIQIDAVRTYARQMFTALRYMERLNIMHADLKPDNIVVNDKYNVLKICDFGSEQRRRQ